MTDLSQRRSIGVTEIPRLLFEELVAKYGDPGDTPAIFKLDYSDDMARLMPKFGPARNPLVAVLSESRDRTSRLHTSRFFLLDAMPNTHELVRLHMGQIYRHYEDVKVRFDLYASDTGDGSMPYTFDGARFYPSGIDLMTYPGESDYTGLMLEIMLRARAMAQHILPKVENVA